MSGSCITNKELHKAFSCTVIKQTKQRTLQSSFLIRRAVREITFDSAIYLSNRFERIYIFPYAWHSNVFVACMWYNLFFLINMTLLGHFLLVFISSYENQVQPTRFLAIELLEI